MSKATQPLICGVTRGKLMATLDEQIELEYQMVQSGINRYNKNLEDLLDKDLGSKTKHGRTIIKGIVEPVLKGIENYEKEKWSFNSKFLKLTKGCDKGQMAYLALISLIDNMIKKPTLTQVAKFVGIQIETQIKLDTWVEEDKEVAHNLIKLANKKSDKGFDHKRHGLNHKMKADGVSVPNWTDEERLHVGIRLIDIIIQETGIVKLESKQSKKKKMYVITPTPETEEWVRAFNATNSVALPRYAPCIIEPKDWESFWGGGYYSEHINKLPLVRVWA